MTVPLNVRGLADEMYAHALVSAYAGTRLYEPSVALHEDPDIDEKMLRDPHIAAMWGKRVRKVAGRKHQISAANETSAAKRLAGIVAAATEKIIDFVQARQELASSALWGGRGYQFIASARVRTSLYDSGPESWCLPTRLEDIDAARIRFDPVHERDPATGRDRIRTVAKLWPLDYSAEPMEIPPEDMRAIVHVTLGDEERRLGYGRGLRDPLYFAFYSKFQLLASFLQAADKWAKGLTVAKIDADAHGGTSQTNAAIAQDFLATMKKTRAEHTIAIDKRDDVTVLWPSGEGWRMFIDGIKYWDDRISALILASVLPTGGGEDVGSNARAETEAGSEDELIAGDREMFDGAWTRGLIGWFLHVNQATLSRLGLAGVPGPKFVTGEHEVEDPQIRIDAVKTAVELGADVVADEFYAALGLQKPDGAPSVIKGKSQQPAPNGGPPGGGGMFRVGDGVARFGEWDESKHPRADDGQFGKGGGGTDVSDAADKPDTSDKPKKAAPGSQLDPDVLDRLRSLGVTKLPEVEATEVEIHDLDGEDVHTRAVATWKSKSGKKQHAYTPEFHAANAAKKWARVEKVMPRVEKIRSGLSETIRSGKVGSSEHEGALIAAIIADTGLRPGNPTSVSKHEHYGVSTLLGSHVTIEGGKARFSYIGKAGKENVSEVDDPDIVAALSRYKETAGDGPMFSAKALDASRSAVPSGVKLKDFRTVQATRTARMALAELHPPPPLSSDPKKRTKEVKAVVRDASKIVAERLNNTPAVAKSSYIHPRVWEEWGKGLGLTPEEMR